MKGQLPPGVWQALSESDRLEFTTIQTTLHNMRPKDGHPSLFRSELELLKAFVERRPDGTGERAIVTGIFFAPGFICVNTFQLKQLIGRCKSSINIGFQQLGYLSAKTKVRKVITDTIPALKSFPWLARQWTMRYLMWMKAGPIRRNLPTPMIEEKVDDQIVPMTIIFPKLSIGHDIDEGMENDGIDLERIRVWHDDEEVFGSNNGGGWSFAEEKGERVIDRQEDEWPSFEPAKNEDRTVELSNWKL